MINKIKKYEAPVQTKGTEILLNGQELDKRRCPNCGLTGFHGCITPKNKSMKFRG